MRELRPRSDSPELAAFPWEQGDGDTPQSGQQASGAARSNPGCAAGKTRRDTHSLGLHPGLLHPKGHLWVLVAQQDVRNTRGWVAGVEMLAAIAQVLLTFQTLPALCKSENSIRLCTGRTWEPQLPRGDRASTPQGEPPHAPAGSPDPQRPVPGVTGAHPRCPCRAAAGWP